MGTMPPTNTPASIPVDQYQGLVTKHYDTLISFAEKHVDDAKDSYIEAQQLLAAIKAEKNRTVANLSNAQQAPPNAPLPAVGSPGASSHPTPLPGPKLDHSTPEQPPVPPVQATVGTGTTVLTQAPQTVAPEVPQGDALGRAPLSIPGTEQVNVNGTTSPVKTDPDKKVDEVEKPSDPLPGEEKKEDAAS